MEIVRLRRLLAVAFGATLAACATPQRHEFEDAAMGTRFRIVLYASDATQAERAARAAFERVKELDRLLSDYRDDSEAARVSGASGSGEFTAVSTDTWRVLALSQSFAELSDGAFDPTVGPVVALWRRARRQGEVPDDARLSEALGRVGWRALELDAATRAARLVHSGMKLDFGGIAKGYALDAALDELARHGVDRALVDGGGDVAVRRAPPGRAGWAVTVRPFSDESAELTLQLVNEAVATSGDAYQALELDGARHSHIVDPRTGRALTTRTSASVIASDGASADALATALCVLGPREGLELAYRAAVDARVARELADEIESRATAGFDARILSFPAAPAPSGAP
jgi:thiamine biosynthesis lipoprotein